MSERVRKPLFEAARPAEAANAYADDPSAMLEAHYRRVWETSMHDMPFVNPALSVTAIGFCRHEGDWVGAVLTPWFLNLFVLPGGGTLWTDLASGDRVRIAFPVGELANYSSHILVGAEMLNRGYTVEGFGLITKSKSLSRFKINLKYDFIAFILE